MPLLLAIQVFWRRLFQLFLEMELDLRRQGDHVPKRQAPITHGHFLDGLGRFNAPQLGEDYKTLLPCCHLDTCRLDALRQAPLEFVPERICALGLEGSLGATATAKMSSG